MPTYDICWIASTRATSKHLKGLQEKINGDQKENNGMLRGYKNYGVRPFPRPILKRTRKHLMGRYIYLTVEANKKLCEKIEKRLYVDEETIRFRTMHSMDETLVKNTNDIKTTWEYEPILSESHYDALRHTTNINYYIARTLLEQKKITKDEIIKLGKNKIKQEPAVEAYELLDVNLPTSMLQPQIKQGLVESIYDVPVYDRLGGSTMKLAGLFEHIKKIIEQKDSENENSINKRTKDELLIYPLTDYQENEICSRYRDDWMIPTLKDMESIKLDDFDEPPRDSITLHDTFSKYIKRDINTFSYNLKNLDTKDLNVNDETTDKNDIKNIENIYENYMLNSNKQYSYILRGRPDISVSNGENTYVCTDYYLDENNILIKMEKKYLTLDEFNKQKFYQSDKDLALKRSNETNVQRYMRTNIKKNNTIEHIDRLNNLTKMIEDVQNDIRLAKKYGYDVDDNDNLIDTKTGKIIPRNHSRITQREFLSQLIQREQ